MPGTIENPTPDDFFPELNQNWLDKDLGKFSTKSFLKKRDNEYRKVTIDNCIAKNYSLIAMAFGAVDLPMHELHDAWIKERKLNKTVTLPATKICSWRTCRKHETGKAAYIPEELTIHVPERYVEVTREENSKAMADEISTKPTKHSLFYLDECMGHYLHHQFNYKIFEKMDKNTEKSFEAQALKSCVGRLSQFTHERMPAFFGEAQASPKGFGSEYGEFIKYGNSVKHLKGRELDQRVKRDGKFSLILNAAGYSLGNVIYNMSKELPQGGDMFWYRGEGSWQGVLRAMLPAITLWETCKNIEAAAEKPAPKGVSERAWKSGQRYYHDVVAFIRNLETK